jgi:hypothetical protein
VARRPLAGNGVSFGPDGTGSTRRGCNVIIQEAIMWQDNTPRAQAMRGSGEDEMAYVAGWTISGLATLGTILAVWIFAV